MKVWILSIDHKYGTDTTIHKTYKRAANELYEYVVRWWPEVNDDKAPSDKGEAIAFYFDICSTKSSPESYSITGAVLQL